MTHGMHPWLRATLAAWLGLFVAAAGAAERTPPPHAALPPLDGEVIVRFKADASVLRRHALAASAQPGVARSVLEQRAGALGGRVGHALEHRGAVGEREQVLRSTTLPAHELARLLAADTEVEYAVPNGRRRALVAPNDLLYAAAPRAAGPDSGQWYLRAPAGAVTSSIDIESAWARTTGSASVVVAVLDTGVRRDHPDLAGQLLPGYDTVSADPNGEPRRANDGNGRDDDPSDPGDWVSQADLNADRSRPLSQRVFNDCSTQSSSWHGTSTSSLVGAATNNGIGMAGAAPGVRILPVRVLGKCYGIDSDIIAGMRWAAGIAVPGLPNNPNPAKIINLSLGGSGSCGPDSNGQPSLYQTAVNEIVARGVVIVAAAGNGAGGAVGVPANCIGVIAVLGLRHVGSKVGFSDLGAEVAISAPGGNCVNVGAGDACLYPILAATDSGTQGPVSSGYTNSFDVTVGTSFSSPLAAAVAALMASQRPLITPAQVRSVLQSTARPFPTTGADNGTDPTPVAACRAPQNGVEQLQCYCNTAVCGAGMLDAGAAVRAVSQAVATVVTASPTAGSAVTLSAAGSLPDAGRTITAWSWSIVDSGGIVSGFSSATNASTASLTPTGAGSFTVRLTTTDDLGRSGSVDFAVSVAAAPVPPVNNPTPTSGGGGGGGGGMAAGWVALLGLATALLLRGRRR